MSDKMIDYGGRKIGERPKKYSDVVDDAVFDKIKDDLASILYYGECDDVELLRADFISAACVNRHVGYNMVRYLEKLILWQGSGELVELFDDAPWDAEYKPFVQQWMDYWKIEPLFKVGDAVKFVHDYETLTSTVVEIDKSWPGRYIMAPQPGESSRPIVRCEDCQAVES